NLGEAQNIRYEKGHEHEKPDHQKSLEPAASCGKRVEPRGEPLDFVVAHGVDTDLRFIGAHALPLKRGPDVGPVKKRTQKLASILPGSLDAIRRDQLGLHSRNRQTQGAQADDKSVRDGPFKAWHLLSSSLEQAGLSYTRLFMRARACPLPRGPCRLRRGWRARQRNGTKGAVVHAHRHAICIALLHVLLDLAPSDRTGRPEERDRGTASPDRLLAGSGSACRRSGAAHLIAYLDGPDGLDRAAQRTAA